MFVPNSLVHDDRLCVLCFFLLRFAFLQLVSENTTGAKSDSRAKSQLVVSTLLVKFELIQKHNKLFVYTLTAHFSSSIRQFMCRRTISFSMMIVEPSVFLALCLLLFCIVSFQFYVHTTGGFMHVPFSVQFFFSLSLSLYVSSLAL